MGCLGDTSDPADISHAAFLRRLLLPSGTAGTNVGKSARYAGENRDPLHWVPPETRDQIVDFVRRWSEKTEIGAGGFIGWLDITASKFYDWRERYGNVNEHNGMTHVRTSPYYPQSNGKIERWHKSLKGECIRPGTPLSLEDARRLLEGYVGHYNDVRLNSAVGYITSKDMLAGRQQEIHAGRDRKLEEARKQRQIRRQQAA